jgi:hypothetical protein
MRTTRCKVLLLISILNFAFAACNTTSVVEAPIDEPTELVETTEPVPCPTPPEERETNTGTISFKGVLLKSKIPSAQTIEAVLVPPTCIGAEDEIPGGVVPQHVSLRLKDDEPTKKTFYDPEINLFPTEGFHEALTNSKSATGYFDESLQTLREIITKKPANPTNLPNPGIFDNGSATVTTHVQYASFNNISGIFYLAHFDFEPDMISNDRLTYVFQGLTNNGKYYVCATYPVKVGWLPKSYDEPFEGYSARDDYYDLKKPTSARESEFKHYLTKIEHRLQRTDKNEFILHLGNIEKTFRTLKID